MAKSKMFLGHKNKTHWNVSLWINNDESLYRLAKDCINDCDTRDDAAHRMLIMLQDENGNAAFTPDGFKYSKSAIRAAMVGM